MLIIGGNKEKLKMTKRKEEGKLERVVFKTVPTISEAQQLVRQLQRQKYNPAFTDAEFISGRKQGYDVYAVARTRTPKGFQAKKMMMVYLN